MRVTRQMKKRNEIKGLVLHAP